MSAQKRYQELSSEIDALIAHLQNLKGNHRAEAQNDPDNWGFVGDLSTVHSHLKDAVDRLVEVGSPER